MKRRIFHPFAIVAIASSFLLLPACRKHQRVAQMAAPPQPSRTAEPQAAERELTQPPKASSEPRRKVPVVPVGYTEQGIASWYGIPYHGRRAADGEIYDMETLVAAHRLLPFNTWLKVTNLANSKSVNVRVIDRGPFVEGRILDLSKAAARQIDLLGPGIGRVRLEVIGAPVDIPTNDFYAVQVGAFSVAANAERVRSEYAQRFGTAQLAVKQGAVPLWRVLIGKEPSISAAQELANVLSAEKRNVFVVRLDETVIKPGSSIVPALLPETAR
jgi:rare lipoprotein A